MKTAQRACLVLLLTALLAPAATFARPARGARVLLPPELRAVVWLVQLWAKHGGGIDPNGLMCAAENPGTEAGGCIDPDGLLASPGKHGGTIDPNGVNPPPDPPTLDARGGMDPNGLASTNW